MLLSVIVQFVGKHVKRKRQRKASGVRKVQFFEDDMCCCVICDLERKRDTSAIKCKFL